jgi:dihydrofolate reductase
MGKLTVTSFITLDNVVEAPNLWSGSFQSEDTGEYNEEVLRVADAMVLGRTTYEGFASAWPTRSGGRFADKFNAMPKYVASTTLQNPAWNNSHVIEGDVAAKVAELKADRNLIVWGSPTLVQYLADHRLVDEYKLLVSPVFRGKGIKLFADVSEQIDLKVVEAKLLSGGMLALHMVPRPA